MLESLLLISIEDSVGRRPSNDAWLGPAPIFGINGMTSLGAETSSRGQCRVS